MKRKNVLGRDDFIAVVRHTPFVSVDLVIKNDNEKILLGYRTNNPAKGSWFVPGGRICKDEDIETALAWVLEDEVGLDYEFLKSNRKISFKGVAEHKYPGQNAFEVPDLGTHYIVLVFDVQASPDLSELPADQHNAFRWFSVDELLNAPDVHAYTKNYFREGAYLAC